MDIDDNDPTDAEADEEDVTCPLFMTGLPKNFDQNPALAAIASLLDDTSGGAQQQDEEEPDNTCPLREAASVAASNRKQDDAKAPPAKASRRVKCKIKSAKPDTKPASVGELQVFVNLWKM